jgi:hypothetical protein
MVKSRSVQGRVQRGCSLRWRIGGVHTDFVGATLVLAWYRQGEQPEKGGVGQDGASRRYDCVADP